MKWLSTIAFTAILFSMVPAFAQVPADKPVPEGYSSLFDGKTLNHWEGDPQYWSVQDGCITGISTPEKPIKYNTFLYWDEEVSDFELLCDFCLTNHNSGIQYRAWLNQGKPWSLSGYQADIAGMPYMGIVYGEGFRGILCLRGQKTTFDEAGKKTAESFADAAELAKSINFDGWNTYRIVAKGNTLTQYINGVKVSELVDNDKVARAAGLLGFQMHVGPAMKVQFKNIFLKK